MNRRNFFAIAAVACVVSTLTIRAEDAGTAGKTWIELRHYTFATVAKREAYEAHLAKAAVPALNRAGISPVGVFTLAKEDNPKVNPAPEGLDLYVVLPHPSAESIATLAGKLDRDAAYREAGKAVIEAPRNDQAFTKLETAISIALDKCPKVETPAKAATRVLQLRTYTGHNEDRALRKAEMFDLGDEIGIFRKTGLNPVFFGRSIAGWGMPNVTYMLGFDTPELQASGWKTFVSSPEWTALKKDPRFADTEPSIVNLVLRPSAGSQI